MVSSMLVVVGGLFLSFPGVLAGFAANTHTNIAVYWGQNSVNRAGSQQRLATYCSNTPVNVIPIAFLNSIKFPTLVNFANAGDNCTEFPGTQLLRCPQIETDIKTCQAAGKTLLLSLGGATYTEGGFSSTSEAISWAEKLWAMFGPPQQGNPANRPFGSSVVDGFDFDFEAVARNMVPFATRLRALMDADTRSGSGKRYYLSAAPQCPFPDYAMGEILKEVSMDFVSIQFYNNYCGAPSYVPGSSGQNNFNFATWDAWAKGSRNPGVKVLLGVPGSPSAAGTGYVGGGQLAAVVAYSRQFSSFGGVMVWDMSQVESNGGFLDAVVGSLSGNVPVLPQPTRLPPLTTTTTGWWTSTRTGPASTGSAVVSQWGQCGGNGYSGPTQCQAPFTCVRQSDWWSHCN